MNNFGKDFNNDAKFSNAGSDGFTGFNPSRTKRDISEFQSVGVYAVGNFCEYTRTFFNDLRDVWASPKAVEFSKCYEPRLNDLCSSIASKFNAITEAAAHAYNIVARANNVALIDLNGFPTVTPEELGCFLHDNIEGKVGMNITIVKDFLLPTYKEKMQAIIRDLEAAPKSIALYDDENGQQHAYSTNISKMITEMSELLESLISSIENYFSTETENILLAKQNATNTFQA